MALLSVVSMQNSVWTPGYLPKSRPSDIFSTEGDVLIRAMTPLHAVMDQTKVTFQQPPEQPLYRQ